MLKELSNKQITTIVKNVSSTYEESLINLSIELVLKDRQSAEYLCDMLQLALDDHELAIDLKELEEC